MVSSVVPGEAHLSITVRVFTFRLYTLLIVERGKVNSLYFVRCQREQEQKKTTFGAVDDFTRLRDAFLCLCGCLRVVTEGRGGGTFVLGLKRLARFLVIIVIFTIQGTFLPVSAGVCSCDPLVSSVECAIAQILLCFSFPLFRCTECRVDLRSHSFGSG